MTVLLALALAVVELPRKAPLEQHPGIEVTAGTVEGSGGQRLRTIVTAPPGSAGWLGSSSSAGFSCDSVELTANPRGANRLLQDLVRKSGALVFRVDKPGWGIARGLRADRFS